MSPLHPTQFAILDRLRNARTSLRFRDIKPPAVESDLYNYHLKQLVKIGYVAKADGRYQLTASGKEQFIEVTPADETQNNRFKLAVMCLVLREGDAGIELLYEKRGRQPMAGQRGFVGGGMQRGEPVLDAATRRLMDKTGLQATFRLMGLVRKRRFDMSGRLYMDILFHVCLATKAEGILSTHNQFGQHYWVSLDEAIRLENEEVMGSPQLAQALGQLRTMAPADVPLFYLEETYQHDIF